MILARLVAERTVVENNTDRACHPNWNDYESAEALVFVAFTRVLLTDDAWDHDLLGLSAWDRIRHIAPVMY